MTINAPAESSPSPRMTCEPAVGAPPSWVWRRAALFLCIAPQLITISALVGVDPPPASWPSLLLAIAPAPLAAAAAFAPVPSGMVAAGAGSAVLVTGIAGAWDHTALLDLEECRFEFGSLLSHPPRLEADGTVMAGDSRWDVESAGLPAELELRVAGNGQYHGRYILTPRPGAKPSLQARLVAAALADQAGRAYSSGQAAGSTR